MEKEVEELLEQLKFGDDFKYDIRDKYKDNAIGPIEVEEEGAERWGDMYCHVSYLFFRISKYNLKSYRVKDALYIGKGRYLSKVNMRFGYKGGRSHNFVDVIGATHKNLGIKPYLFKTPLEAAAFYFVYKNYVKKVKKVSRFDQKGLKEMYQIRNELNNFLSKRKELTNEMSDYYCYNWNEMLSSSRVEEFNPTKYMTLQELKNVVESITADHAQFVKKRAKQEIRQARRQEKYRKRKKLRLWRKKQHQIEKERKQKERQDYRDRFTLE